jgi:hypothetical protein
MTVRHPLRDQFYHLFLAPRQQDQWGMKRDGQDMSLHVRHPDLKDVILQGRISRSVWWRCSTHLMPNGVNIRFRYWFSSIDLVRHSCSW